MEGRGAIELSTRVFVVSIFDKETQSKHIWVGRVQKMGREINKRTYEFHHPVHMNKIPTGGLCTAIGMGAWAEQTSEHTQWPTTRNVKWIK
jgi:hypothetical protein